MGKNSLVGWLQAATTRRKAATPKSGGSSQALTVVLPGRTPETGTANTPTFDPTNANQVLTVPAYREHLTDIFNSRTANDSRTLMKQLFVNDPDVSSALNAYLTTGNTPMLCVVKDINDQVDPAGQQILNEIMMVLTTRSDYSEGFKMMQSLNAMNESFRYMLLLRGAIAGEMILSPEFYPVENRVVDTASLRWYERQSGKYVPVQESDDGSEISLDIPTFFFTTFRRDPTEIYTSSFFVSSVNTIAARQEVINDLYRIMRVTGFPRIHIKVLEEVVLKNVPAAIKNDPDKVKTFVRERMTEISTQISNLRPDQAFVSYDSVESSVMNEKTPGVGINIDSIINTFNQQNQAALRTMSTILGRGDTGVNTASVEARIFSMNAEELNKPIADFWEQFLTLAIRLRGSQGYVSVTFAPVELRPRTELEPQLTLRAARLREDLSLGLITDVEYHLEMYNRLPPPNAPLLSGTGFMSKTQVSAGDVSPNSDPLGRSVSPQGGSAKTTEDNKV